MIAFFTLVLVIIYAPLWCILVVDVLLLFVGFVGTGTMQRNQLMQKAYAQLIDGCDPYPLLREAEEQLTYKNTGAEEQLLHIHYSCALLNAGQTRRAYEVLAALNIDKYAGMLPAPKFVYYGLLSEACHELGDFEKAGVWYGKQVQFYQDMLSSKEKQQYEPTMRSSQALAHFRRQEYTEALAALNAVQPQSLQAQVDFAWQYAKVYYVLGQPEKTQEYLQYIVQRP